MSSELCEKAGEKPEVNLKIELQREFNHDTKLGWFWHKSWNIPNINIFLEVSGGRSDSGIGEREKKRPRVTFVGTNIDPSFCREKRQG